MAKLCPRNDSLVIYLDCLECEYRMDCSNKYFEKETEKDIDKDE